MEFDTFDRLAVIATVPTTLASAFFYYEASKCLAGSEMQVAHLGSAETWLLAAAGCLIILACKKSVESSSIRKHNHINKAGVQYTPQTIPESAESKNQSFS